MILNVCIHKFKITLPNGAIVQYRVGQDWLYNIHITPSIFDEDNVEGLCGNSNGDTTDDFIPQGSSFSTDNFLIFQDSWRYFVCLDYYNYVMFLTPDKGVKTIIGSYKFMYLLCCKC